MTATTHPVPSIAPGSARAVGGLALGPALAALFGAMMIQIGTNFANDVFDFEKGADTDDRLGPVRAAAAGLLTPAQMRTGMVAAFGSAFVAGVYLTAIAGWPIVAIGLASIASGIAYTGGPYPLGYHGLGDIFVLAFFGFVAVCGTAFVQVGGVPELAWWASIPVGALATAILVVNNVRDRETDVGAGKRTLAVRFGRAAGIAEYATLLAAAYAVPVALWMTDRLGAEVLLPTATAPLAAACLVGLARTDGPALNRILVRTAQLLLVFGALFAAGIALGAP
jgi:1,4-dihydroxy-2-naphthoate octaprenyltransferase